MSGKKIHDNNESENANSVENEEAIEATAPSAEAFEELAKKFNKHSVKGEKEGSAEQLEKIATLELEVKTLSDKILRLNAEMENLRRRHQKERSEAQRNGIRNFASDMANVLDNLHRALDSIDMNAIQENETLKNIHTGVDMTRKSMESSFERYNVERINPQDEVFDHNLHQAVSQVEDTEKESGTVLQVIQPGYTIEGKLLRPAMVIVSK